MKRVIVESPYAGDVDTNVTYARRAVADSLRRGEAPIASHLLHTQPGILDDTDPDQRRQGIDAGLVWCDVADLMAVYTDHGVTAGMHNAIKHAHRHGLIVEHRTLGGAA